MWKRLIAWWAGDLAAQHLDHLDDRLLADIGLEREDIRDRVFGGGENLALPEEDAAGSQTLDFQSICRC